ncbi:hypothetical protein JOQ06_026282 [Pogonophryne albipinna]|uniref:Phosphodiester glycosidase domain-containing protein n=1 Tax=Pogonophryne albipinna TaxID=1090488 RepID=A0AAD6A6L3_9TELE|nr:hypothetical protein JOQ06_026282 [Pogonophryne albipinna]
MTVVPDPLRQLSVLEPGQWGGCEGLQRVSVEETAGAAGCLYAQNAGFFNTESGACLGNVVSDGRMVRDSGGVQNAQFGIRRDGTLVFGYLSQEDVLDRSNPFEQLVSGVVWLLRNGEVYINQSLKAECDKTQETGKFRTFVDVVSGRTAVGHDAEGRLVLFHIDGQTGVRGMNLWEMAESLKSYGVVNAINLDGGGSSTFVINGSLASYPSDHCKPDSRWRCARHVSTVLCVHRRRCQPADCSGHGSASPVSTVTAAIKPAPVLTAVPVIPSTDAAHAPPASTDKPVKTECVCDHQCPCDPQTGSCNATLRAETNYTLHTAGRCLANQMFTLWRREEEEHREQPRLTERSWVLLSCSLAALLSLSLLLHLLRACRGAACQREPEGLDYSYVPLTHINGDAGKSDFQLDDSDSQDEIWAPFILCTRLVSLSPLDDVPPESSCQQMIQDLH